MASHRNYGKRISAESSVMSRRRPTRSRDTDKVYIPVSIVQKVEVRDRQVFSARFRRLCLICSLAATAGLCMIHDSFSRFLCTMRTWRHKHANTSSTLSGSSLAEISRYTQLCSAHHVAQSPLANRLRWIRSHLLAAMATGSRSSSRTLRRRVTSSCTQVQLAESVREKTSRKPSAHVMGSSCDSPPVDWGHSEHHH